jgi:CheY-like chemotaxis protein
MTANAMTGDRERCMAAGMDDYIAKPFRRDELSSALARVPGGPGLLRPDPGSAQVDPASLLNPPAPADGA